MKKRLLVLGLIAIIILCGCQSRRNDVIGGADKPTDVYVEENNAGSRQDVIRFLKDCYVNEQELPVFDMTFDREYLSGDRKLILDDSIDNEPEYMVYDYYLKSVSGKFRELYDMIGGENLKNALLAEEKNFNEGIYLSEILIDEIDLIDRDDIEDIGINSAQKIAETIENEGIDEFAVVGIEKTIIHNEKSLSTVPQVGNGEVERYYLLGKKDGAFKIYEVYWEGFVQD